MTHVEFAEKNITIKLKDLNTKQEYTINIELSVMVARDAVQMELI